MADWAAVERARLNTRRGRAGTQTAAAESAPTTGGGEARKGGAKGQSKAVENGEHQQAAHHQQEGVKAFANHNEMAPTRYNHTQQEANQQTRNLADSEYGQNRKKREEEHDRRRPGGSGAFTPFDTEAERQRLARERDNKGLLEFGLVDDFVDRDPAARARRGRLVKEDLFVIGQVKSREEEPSEHRRLFRQAGQSRHVRR